MAKHEFGIVDEIMYNVRYDFYEPEEYSCISVDDDFIDEMLHNYYEDFQKMKAYAHTTSYPIRGLNYIGITLIPPESLQQFSNIVTSANKHYKSQQLQLLLDKISKAMRDNKFLIHFGI